VVVIVVRQIIDHDPEQRDEDVFPRRSGNRLDSAVVEAATFTSDRGQARRPDGVAFTARRVQDVEIKRDPQYAFGDQLVVDFRLHDHDTVLRHQRPQDAQQIRHSGKCELVEVIQRTASGAAGARLQDSMVQISRLLDLCPGCVPKSSNSETRVPPPEQPAQCLANVDLG